MDLSGTLRQIDSLKKEGEGISSSPEKEKVFWDKFRLEFNYNSNHIEGNTLTYGHTQLLLLFDKIGGDYTGREIEEMKAHDLALKMIEEAAADEGHLLTEKFIKEINKLILVRPYYKEAITPDGQPTRRLIKPGEYKEYPNSVRLENGEIFNYASPSETPALMGDLLSWLREETDKNELHPVQIAALLHYRFVKIHPFDDSNGRTSRLLMNYVLLRNGYAPLVVESADKKNYLTALNDADTGNLQAFEEYITGKALKWQNLYLRAFKGENIKEDDDFSKEVEILKKRLTNSKDSYKKTLTKESFQAITKTSIIPLILKSITELHLFNDLFLETNISIWSKDNYATKHNIQKDDLLKIFDIISDDISGSNEIELQLNIVHSKLKNTNFLEFGHASQISLLFDKYYYQVSIPGTILKNFYNVNLTSEEIDQLAKNLARQELDAIKSKTSL